MTYTKSKIIKSAYQQFLSSQKTQLSDCYANPTKAKREAFDRCIRLCYLHNYDRYRILGYNTNTFSFGFTGLLGNKPAFFYITKEYDRCIFLDELQEREEE